MPPAAIPRSCDSAGETRDAVDIGQPRQDGIKQKVKGRAAVTDAGRIRLGGGCRLPLRGAPMEHDRLPRSRSNQPE